MPILTGRSQRRGDRTMTRSFFDAVRKGIFARSSRVNHSESQYAAPYNRAHFIHFLPTELLAHIFIAGAEVDDMFAMNISQVCHAWRSIALHTPKLWRRICLSPYETLWRTWIHRAKSCSLDVQLLPYYTSRPGHRLLQRSDYNLVQWYMRSISRLIPRWRSLEIVFATYSPFLWNAALSECCAYTSRVHAPLLEEMHLIYPANDDSKEYWLFNGVAPNLRRVTVDGIRLSWAPSLYANLTYLDYTHHRFSAGWSAVHEVLSILHVSHHLTSLKIMFRWSGADPCVCRPPNPIPRLSLAQLETLQINNDGPDIPSELLALMRFITFPSLKSLYLADLSESPNRFHNLSHFFAAFRLPRKLHSIRLEHGWYDQDLAARIIRSMPWLSRHLYTHRRRRQDSKRHYH
ncbi:hypothetical protein PTI98_011015 [Pleurotus ostreatus]|nr:hypothetical protein PTI98_011015 [Pleurotus ostreatus]